MAQVAVIKLVDIRENPVALRPVNEKSPEFAELVDSIRDRGVLNAISVREQLDNDTGKKFYALIDGLHRFSAAKQAGLDEIPASIMTMNDAQVEEAQIIANVHKIETRPVEYSKQIQRLLARNPLMRIADLSKLLAKSPAWVNERLGLLKLSPEVAKLVDDNDIGLSNAYALAKLPPEEQLAFLTQAQTENPAEFCPKINERVQAIRSARSKGKDAGEIVFEPSAFLQKIGDIKQERETMEVGRALIRGLDLTTAEEAWAMAINWVLHLDPHSAAAQVAKEEQRKAKLAADKEARAKEREEKKATEARAKQLSAEEASA
jgi:ParB/RepB/Spo0J family partition protein